MVPKGKAARKSAKTPPQDDGFFKASDFKSIELSFEINNTTTRTKFRDPGEIRLIQMGDRELTLEVAPRSCAMGHGLMMSINAVTPEGETFPFSCTAKVEESERPDDSRMDRIRVALVQFNETDWEIFRRLFADRQNDIEKFFQAARGY